MRRRRANKVALAAAALLLGAAAPAPKGPEIRIGPPSQQYEQCLALAGSNPKAALAAAQDWRDAGGGFPAGHCAAVALIGLKQYDAAAKRLEELAGAMMAEPAPLRAAALDQAGQAWLMTDRFAPAKADFDAALKLDSSNAEYWIDRAEALAGGDQYWDAIDDLNRALELAPNNVDALLFRASAYRAAGGADGLDLALADVERALKLAPDSASGLLERGNILRLKGDAAGARRDWQRVTLIAPRSSAAEFARNNLAHINDSPGASLLITAPPQKN